MAEGGFVYDSDIYNDDLPYYVQVKGKRHLVIPYSFTYNDGKFGMLPAYGGPADFADNLKRGFDQLWREGATHPKMMSIGLHPRLIGQASRIDALREFFDHALGKGQVLFTRRIDIAASTNPTRRSTPSSRWTALAPNGRRQRPMRRGARASRVACCTAC